MTLPWIPARFPLALALGVMACSEPDANSSGPPLDPSGGSPTGGLSNSGGNGTSSGGEPGSTGGTPSDGGTTGSGGSESTGSTSSGGMPPATGGSNGMDSGGTSSGGTGGTGTGGSAPLPEEITVWIAGDSTVANGNTPCPRGWGAEFSGFFDAGVTVVNRAVGGRSVWTWLYDVQGTMGSDGECNRTLDQQGQPVLQYRWMEMLDGMKPGDFLLIQFGINDGDPSCPRHVGGQAFREAYVMMAREAQERGTHPVFITPVSAIKCSGASAVGTRGFLTETFAAAELEDVPVIDLHASSIELYDELGFCPLPAGHSDVSSSTPGEVGEFFCDDHTHFDKPGAVRIAELVTEALVDQNIALHSYLSNP